MARAIVPLFVVQFFSWSGMFALWIYAVPAITRSVFSAGGGQGPAYRTGLLWVSGGFAGYALLAACLAFALPRAVARFGYRYVHGVGLIVGGGGIGGIALAHRAVDLVPAFIAIGVAWSCIGNLPYTIVSLAVPPDRIAHHMRWFGFSTVVPQAVATFALAWASAALFSGAIERVLLVGAGSMALAGVIALVTMQSIYDYSAAIAEFFKSLRRARKRRLSVRSRRGFMGRRG